MLSISVMLTACGSNNFSSSGAPPAGAPQSTPVPQAPPPSASAAVNPPQEWQKPVVLTDAEIPPLPVVPFPMARSPEVVRAVYAFAARHPEVLSHVPCFCGCESRGHRHNDDCFVTARDPKGRPTSWEPHGMG